MTYTLITTDEQLLPLIDVLSGESELAIDLEMEANFHHYGQYISLVQISTRTKTWILDMLSIKDPKPVCSLLTNNLVTKVFHDVSFDFRIVKQLWGITPKNIIDTKMAALLCGRTTINLGGLLEEEFGLEQDKKFQRSDWMQRPLPKLMLDYAAQDTVKLLELKDVLINELHSKHRYEWFVEEMTLLDKASYEVPVHCVQSIKGSRSLTDTERGRLDVLYDFREELAEKLDRPVFFIIPDKILLELARNPPKEYQWLKLRGVHPLVRRQGQLLTKNLMNAQPIAKEKKPRNPRLTDEQEVRAQQLMVVARQIALTLGVDPSIVLTREQATTWAVRKDFNTLKEYQKELFKKHKPEVVV